MRCSGIGVCLPAAIIGLWMVSGCAEEPPAGVEAPTASTHGEHDDRGHGHSHGHESQEHASADSLEKPAGYAEAVRRIKAYRETIREAIHADRPTEAHRPLDALDQVLQWLPGITRESEIPKKHWRTVGESARRLRDLFEQLHGRIDEGRNPDYEAVAGEIDDAIRKLESVQTDESAGGEASPESSSPSNAPETPETK